MEKMLEDYIYESMDTGDDDSLIAYLDQMDPDDEEGMIELKGEIPYFDIQELYLTLFEKFYDMLTTEERVRYKQMWNYAFDDDPRLEDLLGGLE